MQYAMPPMGQHKCSRGEHHGVVAVLQLGKLHLPEFPQKFLSCVVLFPVQVVVDYNVTLHGMSAVFKYYCGYVITAHGFCSQETASSDPF